MAAEGYATNMDLFLWQKFTPHKKLKMQGKRTQNDQIQKEKNKYKG